MWVFEYKQVHSYRTYTNSRIVFTSIFLIKILIDCNSVIYYIRFVVQKAAFEKIIDFNLKKTVFVIKIIDLNAKVSAKKNNNGCYF